MNESFNHWWAEIQNIINYPLLELGDSRLTLNSIVKLLLVMTLVVPVERFLRRIIRRRVLAHIPQGRLGFPSRENARQLVLLHHGETLIGMRLQEVLQFGRGQVVDNHRLEIRAKVLFLD
jgi:hypothetical protein